MPNAGLDKLLVACRTWDEVAHTLEFLHQPPKGGVAHDGASKVRNEEFESTIVKSRPEREERYRGLTWSVRP